ncbi:MAG: hypothetical protein AAGI25_10330 [Bacteroidota bacterium]
MERGSIQLTPEIFNILFEELKEKLATKYNSKPELMSKYQLFGYANFDEKSPSIKMLIYDETKNWINGKYLYNKFKQFKNGEKHIRLSREYVYVFFKALGYGDFNAFLNNSPHVEGETLEKQLSELKITKTERDEHFVGYYLGENKEVISNYLRIYNGRRLAEWRLYYRELEGIIAEYKYFGKVSIRENSISIYFAYEDSEVYRSAYVNIYFDYKIKFRPILYGCYAGFDENMRPVSGEVIFIRQNDDFTPDLRNLQKVDPIIIQHLTNKRIITDNKFPETLYDLSINSKYVFQLSELYGVLGGIAIERSRSKTHLIVLEIPENTIRCTLQVNSNTYFGYLKSLSNGILEGEFLSGSEDEKISIYLKSQFDPKQILIGRINGFSKRLQIFSGELFLSKNEADVLQIIENQTIETTTKRNYPSAFSSFLRNEIQVEKKEDINHSPNKIAHLIGNYFIYYSEAFKLTKLDLQIDKNAEATLKNSLFEYKGQVKIYGLNMIAIDLKTINDDPTAAQLLLFVGRVEGRKIKLCTGTWQYPDFLGRPKCSVVAMHHAEQSEDAILEYFEKKENSCFIKTENTFIVSE